MKHTNFIVWKKGGKMPNKRPSKKKSGGTIEAELSLAQEEKVVDIFRNDPPDPYLVGVGNLRPKVFRSEPTLRYAQAQKALKRMKKIAANYSEAIIKAPAIDHEDGTTSLSIVMEVSALGGGKDFIAALEEVTHDADSFGVSATLNETVVVEVSFLNTHTMELAPWK